jgi:catalase
MKKTSSHKPKSSAGLSSKTTSARSTVGGPDHDDSPGLVDPLSERTAGLDELAAQMPFNRDKAREYGSAPVEPEPGARVEVDEPTLTASTLTEAIPSDKVGSGEPSLGTNPTNQPLDRTRVDSSGRALTTNQGVPVADNQSSLKAGLRGPTLLEDFILREKITHFDHERIPERVVHARGTAAHGYFECYQPMTDYTRADLFSEAGKVTPVFARFSTVVGERGSADTVRDVRGFAVKFYTEAGNWDLVGNNMPVFFIQDAIKFPDLIHAAKPEPHFAVPQASTAHDTFWDFVSLTPESTHMLMWLMSSRALPRSYRMMQGFGVHTFRLVNEKGESTFVKFHWRPLAGTHSLDWEECVKIAGADPDFHRRDLWEAIEAGVFPEWELSFQLFSEEQAERFSFDVLDATKLVPEEVVPLTPVGKMVLNRNPDNFFAETEQVAFCASHIVPGIDFSNDPLLAGRLHSYQDTQLTRLGGANFHEIPINASVAQVHNNQREGSHRQAINRGRIAYEPNSLAGGCPFQAGGEGFSSFRQPVEGDKVRGKPESFADHYSQATLFWNSQTPIEKLHILRAFRFELSRVTVPAVRHRVVSMLLNVDDGLARTLAKDLGMAEAPEAMPRALEEVPRPEVERSPALSIFSNPGDGSIRARRVAILVADGVDGAAAKAFHAGLAEKAAVPRYVGARLGTVNSEDGGTLEVAATFETMPSVLWDGVVVPGGKDAVKTLMQLGQSLDFLKEQYRHAKPILALAAGSDLLESAMVPLRLSSGKADPGLIVSKDGKAEDVLSLFKEALARHRHPERETDPPET